jgi:hypothetical protein
MDKADIDRQAQHGITVDKPRNGRSTPQVKLLKAADDDDVTPFNGPYAMRFGGSAAAASIA